MYIEEANPPVVDIKVLFVTLKLYDPENMIGAV